MVFHPNVLDKDVNTGIEVDKSEFEGSPGDDTGSPG